MSAWMCREASAVSLRKRSSWNLKNMKWKTLLIWVVGCSRWWKCKQYDTNFIVKISREFVKRFLCTFKSLWIKGQNHFPSFCHWISEQEVKHCPTVNNAQFCLTYIIGLKRTNENNLEGQIIFQLYVVTATGVLEVDKFISKKEFEHFQKIFNFLSVT